MFRQLIFFFFLAGRGGGDGRLYDKEKICNSLPDPVTFYDFIFEQIPHEKK